VIVFKSGLTNILIAFSMMVSYIANFT